MIKKKNIDQSPLKEREGEDNVSIFKANRRKKSTRNQYLLNLIGDGQARVKSSLMFKVAQPEDFEDLINKKTEAETKKIVKVQSVIKEGKIIKEIRKEL